jgi:hypothetical protein
MIQNTSIKAYENEIAPNLGRKQAAIRRLLLVNPAGMTNAEIARALEWTINRVTPRVNELVHFKDANGKPNPVLVDAGTRTCRVTGRTAHVWKLKYQPAPPPPPKAPSPLQRLFPEPVKVAQRNQV